jgi:oligoribonuclease NrnB/cAMP/cGMP phosphodiesterase (DHH superfamily)
MVCTYHNKDLDGYCSAAVIKRKFPDAKLIGWDYGNPIPWDQIPENEPVVMIDISFPMEDMVKVSERSKKHLTWIDHHISAYKEWKEIIDKHPYSPDMFLNPLANIRAINYVYESGIAACEIAWKYYFPDEKIPEAVLLLGEYDTWRKNDADRWENEILPFQYFMRLKFLNPEIMPLYLMEENTYISECIQDGKLILDYQRAQDTRAMKGSFVCEFQGLRALCLNIGGASSNTFLSVWDETKHDIMIPFFYTGRHWTCSIYTTKEDIDCSVIAKSLGGGGHRKAAGFILNELPENFKK